MIKILTTNIHLKISGGTIFNSQLLDFLLSKEKEAAIEIIECLNDYHFITSNHYIIDGILISNDLDLNRHKKFKIYFLVHLWPSQNPSLSAEMKKQFVHLEKVICKSFCVFVTGITSLNYVSEILKCDSNTIKLITPGIPKEWRVKTNHPKLPKKLIYLSNFIEGKGHMNMLKIITNLNSDTISVDCYGEILSKSYYNDFTQQIANHQLKNVHYIGVVNYDQINQLLLNYDLLIHFSEYESFGMSCMEAIASHLPLVVLPTGNHQAYTAQKVKGVLNTFEIDEAEHYLREIITSESCYKEHLESLFNFEASYWEDTFTYLLVTLNAS